MSEQSTRVEAVLRLAEAIFENKEKALQWMSMPNQALGGNVPLIQCETELGAQQVRRTLNAMEWGGAV